MTAHKWNYNTALQRIQKRLGEVADITIVDYTRNMSLQNIPKSKAYLVQGAHVYIDIINVPELFNHTVEETEHSHKVTLTFLNRHIRALQRLINETDATLVDVHNQRLHAVVPKPYDNGDEVKEKQRIEHAVANAQLVIDVLSQTGDDDKRIADAKVRVGIDSGMALAVNNGRPGAREPLFLGNPANRAAKMLKGNGAGIYLTNNARRAIGLHAVETPEHVRLTQEQVQQCVDNAALGITVDQVIRKWKQDLADYPPKSFFFSRHTPPMRDLDLGGLTPNNSRRQDVVSLYADIDGFTAYINNAIAKFEIDELYLENAIRALHVLRSELDAVLSSDFAGLKVRFIGDCIHGITVEGTAHNTDEQASADDAVLCSAALHSGFELAREVLNQAGIDVSTLGLQVGLEMGITAMTRLGMKGQRLPCVLSRSVLRSEQEQIRCDAAETAIGKVAYDAASPDIQNLFTHRKASGMDYDEMLERLDEMETADVVEQVQSAPYVMTSTKSQAQDEFRPHSESFRPHCK